MSSVVAELLIARRQKGLHEVYDRYKYLDGKRHAMGSVSDETMGIVEPQDNVVSIRANVRLDYNQK